MPGFAALLFYINSKEISLANFHEKVDMSLNVLGVIDCNDVWMNQSFDDRHFTGKKFV
jgi:hypothetical protein